MTDNVTLKIIDCDGYIQFMDFPDKLRGKGLIGKAKHWEFSSISCPELMRSASLCYTPGTSMLKDDRRLRLHPEEVQQFVNDFLEVFKDYSPKVIDCSTVLGGL